MTTYLQQKKSTSEILEVRNENHIFMLAMIFLLQ